MSECYAVIEEYTVYDDDGNVDDIYGGHWCKLAADHEGPHQCGGSNCTLEWEGADAE